LPLLFNESFWFLSRSVFESLPFGPANTLVLVGLDVLTLPLLAFIFYGLLKGVAKKEKPSILLLLCLALASLQFLARYRNMYPRLIMPIMPLFGIAFAGAFSRAKKPLLKKAALALFSIFAVYSLAFSAAYVLHYNADYARHEPLFAEIGKLPAGSTVAIHSNKARQISFLYDTGTVACGEERGKPMSEVILCVSSSSAVKTVNPADSEGVYSSLRQLGATHLAETCYKSPWGETVLPALEAKGKIAKVYSDQCSILYEIR
ncbi:MAG: hypothetical protein NTW59_04810, partial [Candidatus Diapherotrites archaeon]|nr:hypothetical protein [Candidatus Diapherotrites archaeon]